MGEVRRSPSEVVNPTNPVLFHQTRSNHRTSQHIESFGLPGLGALELSTFHVPNPRMNAYGRALEPAV